MILYKRAPYHTLIHFLLGFIANWIPAIGVIAVLYQILQLLFDIRTFPIEGVIKPGNSLSHTGLKLFEMGLGYSVGYLMKKYVFD